MVMIRNLASRASVIGFIGMLVSSGHAEPMRGTLVSPVSPACISSPFGPRNVNGPRASRVHNGMDLPAPAGAWVRAIAAGEVIGIRRRDARGLEVIVKHGESWTVRYAHLGAVAPGLASGRRAVASGETIGRVGRTGITYGTHLHLEMTVNGVLVDPALYFSFKRCGQSAVG